MRRQTIWIVAVIALHILKDKLVFTVVFYPEVKYPESELLDICKSIVASIEKV